MPDNLSILQCETPEAWIRAALNNKAILLNDHANCEKKAASTAMSLMYRYVDRPELLEKMSQLAREELLHFEQVVQIMRDLAIDYTHLGPSRYASSLHKLTSSRDPERLVDSLLVGAFIEARSCERFAALVPHLDQPLQKFYRSLLKSEERHFMDYLYLARLYAENDIGERILSFGSFEAELISSDDKQFRFHSGCPSIHN